MGWEYRVFCALVSKESQLEAALRHVNASWRHTEARTDIYVPLGGRHGTKFRGVSMPPSSPLADPREYVEVKSEVARDPSGVVKLRKYLMPAAAVLQHLRDRGTGTSELEEAEEGMNGTAMVALEKTRTHSMSADRKCSYEVAVVKPRVFSGKKPVFTPTSEWLSIAVEGDSAEDVARVASALPSEFRPPEAHVLTYAEFVMMMMNAAATAGALMPAVVPVTPELASSRVFRPADGPHAEPARKSGAPSVGAAGATGAAAAGASAASTDAP